MLIFFQRRSGVRLALPVLAASLCFTFSAADLAASEPAITKPVPIILDTDIGPDCDDVGAVAVLHALADRGEAQVLAMVVSATGDTTTWGPPCLDALNTYHGRPDVPIGVLRGPGSPEGSRYSRQLAEEFPNDLKTGEKAEEAVALYRRTLAAAEDASVVVVTVGYLTNIRDLRASPADAVAPLTGRELVAKKCKLWACMGGQFPSGREWNIHRDAPAAIAAFRDWPTPVLLSGYEVGSLIKTGATLKETPVGNPARRAYPLYVGGDAPRESWDQTAVLAAVHSDEPFWKLSEPGEIVVGETGANEWKNVATGRHRHLILTDAPAAQRAIDALMTTPPQASAAATK